MERHNMYKRVADRAVAQGYKGNMLALLMDIESADKVFNLDFERMLEADDENFAHDINGIINNIDRSTYPATNFNHFVPRFSRN